MQESRVLTMVPSVFAGRLNVQLDPMPMAKEIEAFGGPVGYVRSMRRLAAMDGKVFEVPAAVAELLAGARALSTQTADTARANAVAREAALKCGHVAPAGTGKREWTRLWCSKCMTMRDVSGIYLKGFAPQDD